MNDRFRDPSDAWYDEASLLLHEDAPEAKWPTPQQLPRPTRVPPRVWGVIMHVAFVAVVCGAAFVGRIDPVLVPVVSFAAMVSIGPRFILAGTGLRPTVDLATGLRLDAQAQAINAKTWEISAWALAISAVIALVAAGYTHGNYADSSTPFWRLAALRWSLLAAGLVALAGLARVESRRARGAGTQADELELELELGDAAEGRSWSERTRARLLVGLLALSSAAASSHVLIPGNEDDSPGRVFVVGPAAARHATWLHERFGLEATGLSLDEAWDRSKQRFAGQAGQLETLTHLADLEGVGFVFIDLRAFPVELGEREDIELVPWDATEPRFAVLATGDVNILAYASSWGGQARTRAAWVRLGPHWTSRGAAEPWLQGDAADRMALARALFAQPAFREPDSDHPQNPPQLNGRSHTLLRGVIFFGLAPDFWVDAVEAYIQMETTVAQRQVPHGLED